METPQEEPYHNDEWLWYRIRPAELGESHESLISSWLLEIRVWRLGRNRTTRTSVTVPAPDDWFQLYGEEGNGVSFDDAVSEMVLHADHFVRVTRPRNHEIFEEQKEAYERDEQKDE